MERIDPIELARLACDTKMKLPAAQLPPEGLFHYHQGVFLLGMLRTWELCGEEKYFSYVKAWVDSVIDENGVIKRYNPNDYDDNMPALLLFPLYEKTGDSRYKKVLDTLVPHFKEWNKNPIGGNWHLERTPNQMWLDGLFMGGPLMAKYGKTFGQPEYFSMVYAQAKLMWDNMRDGRTGLLKHAWDYECKEDWADPVTGLAPEFWGRALGWYATALFETAEDADPDNAGKLREMGRLLLEAVANYQDRETGLWYQIVNKGNMPDNWLELSCSCLFVYSICKAVEQGALERSFLENARRGFEGAVRLVDRDETGIQIGHVCIGTGIGQYSYYIQRPVSVNDLHGMGAFLLMVTEWAKIEKLH